MAQIRDARSARIAHLRHNIKLALTRNMNEPETLGLESLSIEKPPPKYARRKAKAKAKPDDQEPVVLGQSAGTLNRRDTTKEAWRPPTVPLYHALPIPPLGRPTSHWTNQPASSFHSTAYRSALNFASYPYPQDYVFNGTQGSAGYQPGQGFTPVNRSSLVACPPTTQIIQNVNAIAEPVGAASVFQKKPGVGPTLQQSPLYSKARLPSESTAAPLGLRTASPPRNIQQSVPKLAQPSQPKTAKSTPPVTHNPPPVTKDGLIHLPAPLPTPNYSRLAHATPSLLPSPQRLLLILDLNGTLLYRSGHIQYIPRPCLKKFLTYALANHSVLIWSSATPKNVKGMCQNLFNPTQRQLLLGQWGRDTLELTPNQYKERVQVYKRLDRVWANKAFQYAHPGFENGERWGQHNTLLIDDSTMKASAQPYNHVEVPEFVEGTIETKRGEKSVLEQVVGYLEYARQWNNVSCFVKEMKFGVNEGWGWDWITGAAQGPERIIEDEDEDEDGGVKL